MKTLLKLIVVVAVINASYRAGMAEYKYSQFKTATRAVLALAEKVPVEEVKESVLKRAAELNLPVSPERVEVSREGVTTSLKVSYHLDIEVFPGFKYPRDYSISDAITPLR